MTSMHNLTGLRALLPLPILLFMMQTLSFLTEWNLQIVLHGFAMQDLLLALSHGSLVAQAANLILRFVG